MYQFLVLKSRLLAQKNPIAAFSIIIQGTFLASIPLDLMGIPVVRQLVGVFLIMVLPGILVISMLGININSARSTVYSVVLSQCILIFIAIILHIVYFIGLLGGLKPMSEEVLISSILLSTTSLTALHYRLSRKTQVFDVSRLDIMNSTTLLGLLLPILALLAAVFQNLYDIETVLVLLLILIAAIPLVIKFSQPSKVCILIWGSALALLFQNSIVMRYLRGGDGQFEYYFSNLVLTNGYWDPTFTAEKNTLLRLTILHPIYAIVGNMDLIWEYKLVHPFLVSLIVIGLWDLYRRQFSIQTATLSVLLFSFLHPFFTNVSRNTRTGFALLLVVAFVNILLDEEINRSSRAFILILLTPGIIFSHNGTSFVFLFLFGVALFSTTIFQRISGYRNPFRHWYGIFILYGVILIAWYTYTSNGGIFRLLLVVFIRDVLFGVVSTSGSGTGSVAKQAISVEVGSFTYRFIRYEFLALTLLMGIGYITEWYRYVGSNIHRRLPENIYQPIDCSHQTDALFLGFGGASLLMFLTAFSPVSIFGIGRVYMIGAIFLVPYVMTSMWQILRWSNSVNVSKTGPRLAAGILFILLLINSGTYATIMVDERSPQPNLNRQDTIDEGSDWELYHLYARYTSKSDYYSALWWNEHRVKDKPVYGSGYQFTGGISLVTTEYSNRKPPGPYFPLNRTVVGNNTGYIYLTEYTTREKHLVPRRHIGSANFPMVKFATFEELRISNTSQIYDNGHSRVHNTDENARA